MNRLFCYTIGLQVPTLASRRQLVMQERLSFKTEQKDEILAICDSPVYGNFPKVKSLSTMSADDDTASTVSSFDDSLSGYSVTFADEIVTAVFVRPATTREEKRELFYSDIDYRRFRYESYCNREIKDTVVKFAPSVVSNIHVYPCAEEKELLFYSATDLQRYVARYNQARTLQTALEFSHLLLHLLCLDFLTNLFLIFEKPVYEEKILAAFPIIGPPPPASSMYPLPLFPGETPTLCIP